jgi:M6 family metalloprotease-like protein
MKRLAVLALALVVGTSACRDETMAPNTAAPDLTAAAPSARSGWFHTQWGDPRGSRGAAQVRHELVDDRGNATVLELDEGLLARLGGPLALDRRRITVDGAPSADGRLAVRSLQVVRGAQPVAGAITGEAGVPRIGAFPYVTVGCKFSDVAAEPHSIATYQSWTGGGSYPGLDNYWIEASFNQMNVSGSTVRGWFTLPQPRSHYVPGGAADLQALVTDCLAAADPTVNFPAFYGINMQFNAVLDCCSWGGSRTMTLDGQTKTYGVTWMADWADVTVYAHEEGHSLGLPHSSGPYAETYDSRWDVMSYGYPFYDFAEGTHIPQHTISYHKDLLGWIAAGRQVTVAKGTTRTITLERLAQPGAGNFLMAKIPIDNAPGQFYTVEARRKVGQYDMSIPADAVVLHRVNPARLDRVAQVVDPDNNGDPNDAGAQWTVGETFADAANAITVKVNAQTATGFQVTITHGATTTSDVWASRAAIPTARSRFALGAVNGLLYAIGGNSGASTVASVQAYNPTSNAWSSKAALPSARTDGDGAAAINGILYVPGGRNASGVVTKTLYGYNASINTWSAKAALPTASGCGGTAVISGLLYVLTGCDATSGFKGLLHRYSPAANAWTTRATAPAAHGFPAAGVISGKLYVAGGRNGTGTATATLHVYTPGTNTWTTRAAMPAARFGASGQVINGRLYVVGGTDAQGTAVATTFVYDPVANQWSTKVPMPTARTGLGAGVAGNLLYAVGGRSGTTDLKTVERYTP